jgi:hypothetical protein
LKSKLGDLIFFVLDNLGLSFLIVILILMAAVVTSDVLKQFDGEPAAADSNLCVPMLMPLGDPIDVFPSAGYHLEELGLVPAVVDTIREPVWLVNEEKELEYWFGVNDIDYHLTFDCFAWNEDGTVLVLFKDTEIVPIGEGQ